MSLIVSVHVYSVQKALLKDSGPLYSVDYDAVKDNLENCSRCVDRTVIRVFTQLRKGCFTSNYRFINVCLFLLFST